MIHEFQDCLEKQKIREELWKPIFELVFVRIKNIKYLTLPGPNCCDLKKFIELNLLKIENTVSVEKEKDFVDKIKEYYAKEVGLTGIDKITKSIYYDHIENLMRSSNFKDRFPFHIINLDLFGSPFMIDKKEESKIFNLFDDVVKVQKLSLKDVYILVTVKLDTPPVIGQEKLSTIKAITKKILNPIEEIIKNDKFSKRINEDYKNKEDWLKIYAIIINIIYQCEKNINIILFSNPYTYIGLSANKKTRMLSFAVKISFSSERPIDAAHHHNKKKKMLNEAIDSIEKTVWVN